jgi:hypothetical protein
MAVKDCKSCGARLDVDDKYCPVCGATVNKGDDPRVKYGKFYLNVFTSDAPRRTQMSSILGMVGLGVFDIVLCLCLLIGICTDKNRIIELIIFVPMIAFGALFTWMFMRYWIICRRTNYFTINDDRIDMSLGFKRYTFSLADIKEIVPAYNSNPKLGAISFGGNKTPPLFPRRVLAFIGQNDKVLFYSIDSPEIFELFDYLGFTVPRVHFGDMV